MVQLSMEEQIGDYPETEGKPKHIRNGKNGWNWFTTMERCRECGTKLQGNGEGDKFCLCCGWFNTEKAKRGLAFYQKFGRDFYIDPEKVVKLSLSEEGKKRVMH